MPLIPMNTGASEAMQAMMVYPNVLYPQRVRYFFYICKEQLEGRCRKELVKSLDKVMEIALVHAEEWHSRLTTVLGEALDLGALHRADHAFFLAQLVHCIPGKYEKAPVRRVRRIGE